MKRPLIASLALCLMVPAVAMAGGGTCANPTPLVQVPNGTEASSTCGGQIGIPLGGAPSIHPAQVYSFRYNPAGANGAAGAFTITGAEREVVVAADCSSGPIGGFAPGVPVNVESLGLTAGQTYILVVGSDSGLPVTDPPRCGAYSFNWVTLPVSLQNFSVD